jgi:hypothetical protein
MRSRVAMSVCSKWMPTSPTIRGLCRIFGPLWTHLTWCSARATRQVAQQKNWPIWRRLLSQGGSLYAALILGLPFHDLTGGFKGLSARVLQTLDLDAIQSNGYAFQIEVTFRAYRSGFRIAECPITFVDRRLGKSKMRLAIVGEAIRIVWALRFRSLSASFQEVRP